MKLRSLSTVLIITLLMSACSGAENSNVGEDFIPSDNPATAEDYANSEGVPIDTNSREYITGLTIGSNFSDFSDAGAIGEDVCSTARDRRIVLSSSGGVGVDPKTASFLNTDDGMQGCIDGFNGLPQD